VIADWTFTTPTIVIQPVTGWWLMSLIGAPLESTWIRWSLALYFFAGVCWLPVVWMQVKMRNMAQAAVRENTALPDRYWTMLRWWVGLGVLAFVSLVVVFYLMVVKPQ
jgi:uncharacterized membrane protein